MVRTGNYSLGKIYKIVSNQTDDIYIGSTSQVLLSTRLAKHKQNFKRWLEGKNESNVTSYEILKYDDAQIILIEDFPCDNKYQLEARERYHIENNKCVNKVRPTRPIKEGKRIYYEKNKEIISDKHKEYYETNKEEIKAHVNEYRLTNVEQVKQRKKEYHERNKDIIHQKKREYHIANKERIINKVKEYYQNNKDAVDARHKEKVTCDICGSCVRKYFLRTHQKTIKCHSLLQKQEQTPLT